jgi:protein-S-isoprenylcysteine O-methyltransferase Ste14
VQEADDQEIFRLDTNKSTVTLFIVLGALFVLVALTDSIRANRRDWLTLAGDIALAILMFAFAITWTKMRVITSRDWVRVIMPNRLVKTLQWSQIQEFSIRGRVFPHGVIVLRDGRIVRIPLLDTGFRLRAHPPSPELIRMIQALEAERIHWTPHHPPPRTHAE